MLVPEGGFVLNNRLSGLAGADALPPGGSRALHTLSPMLLEHNVHSVLAVATPGADGEVQILVQLARLLLDAGIPVDAALDVPRWRAVRGSVLCEEAFDAGVADGLAALGHAVEAPPEATPLRRGGGRGPRRRHGDRRLRAPTRGARSGARCAEAQPCR